MSNKFKSIVLEEEQAYMGLFVGMLNNSKIFLNGLWIRATNLFYSKPVGCSKKKVSQIYLGWKNADQIKVRVHT